MSQPDTRRERQGSVTRLRVLTLNLFGRRRGWPERRQAILTGLRALQPDLLGFQEAIVDDEYDQIRDLLGPEYHVVHQSKREPGEPPDVESCELAFDQPIDGVWASDHFGLVADLTAPKRHR